MGPGTANPTAEQAAGAKRQVHPGVQGAAHGGQGINRLLHFDRFINLEVLWLNDNEVTPTLSVFILLLEHSRDEGNLKSAEKNAKDRKIIAKDWS